MQQHIVMWWQYYLVLFWVMSFKVILQFCNLRHTWCVVIQYLT